MKKTEVKTIAKIRLNYLLNLKMIFMKWRNSLQITSSYVVIQINKPVYLQTMRNTYKLTHFHA